MNGTTTEETLAILWIPPIITSAASTVTITAAATVAQEYSVPKMETICSLFGSKNDFVAEAIPFTCVMVPIPSAPAQHAKNANSLPSHFHFLPIPFSM